jgi:hypothetical protein
MVEEQMRRNSSDFDDHFVEISEDDMVDSTRKEINESGTGEE